MPKKLGIVGASYFQNPLILKAQELGYETHVFAWEAGDIGERTADVFYPISITEKEQILQKCQAIGIDGICSIGSDLANITVSYVANAMGLTTNLPEVVFRSTNKFAMREAFRAGGDPSPRSVLVEPDVAFDMSDLSYPLIVKPVDRSGSRGITRVESEDGLSEAIDNACAQGFQKKAVVEEFVEGEEYSVECISWQGQHTFLALTKKYTTRAPHFIETGHLEPAPISDELRIRIVSVVKHALDTLGVQYGASHAEVLVNSQEEVSIVEIGSRMGGDCIGSDLVYLSTGIDFTRAVIDVALGMEPDLSPKKHSACAMIRFIFGPDDVACLREIQSDHSELLQFVSPIEDFSREVVDSSTRFGFFILQGETYDDLAPYLPVLA